MTRALSLAVLLLVVVAAAAQTRPPAPVPANNPAPAAPEFKDLDEFMRSLPNPPAKPLDLEAALLFSAVPLGCVDELQARPSQRGYFWQPTYKVADGYDKARAFYGCNDWQTAVNATWTMVTLLKRYPDLPVSGLIREKLTDHLGRSNLEGEVGYFKTAGGFQRPYGYGWYLKLFAELATWKDPDGSRYAENVTPLARQFADSLVSFLIDVERPNRAASTANSAFMLGLLLDYVDATRDMTISRAAKETAKRIFMSDTDCATDMEAVQPEMLSPCLSEASVMSRTLEQTEFVKWFDKFMPAAHSNKFKPLRGVNLEAVGRGRGGRGGRGPAPTPETDPAARGGNNGPQIPPRATWTGLAFTRAEAFSRVATALPTTDARVAVYKRLAVIHADIGQKGLADPAAFETPWVGTFAVSYLTMTGNSR